MIRPILIIFLSLIIFSGCYYDSEEYLYPQIGCDSTNITFSGSVEPIINSFCVSCHSSNNTIKFNNYDNIKIQVDNGSLLGTINHESGYLPMPQGGSKLDDCKISIITKWIDDGAPNN